jgi:hypothetical protein
VGLQWTCRQSSLRVCCADRTFGALVEKHCPPSDFAGDVVELVLLPGLSITSLVALIASFFQVLHSIRVRQGCEDRLWWIASKQGIFKLKALFFALACNEGRSFPWKSVWRT